MIDALRFAHVRNPIDVFRIIVPIYAPSITIGICFSFVLILSCLGITLLIIPAGSGSLPISIYNFMHYGSEQAVHTLGIVLTAILFIALTPIYLISKSSGNRYD
ncbi:hypothetical protein [Vibrio agarivorans]|uniref:ABC transmembrane type-1 domain-containing protein n=1 Tax=Vibrio agarivorans TaxID=153622 RepID=A0ABT7Y0E0_9VIBR|nr:hypothetical protein [Vibrio agarivorans]MDN2481508.1 hypothetical protein [Vibrio agarivorans]